MMGSRFCVAGSAGVRLQHQSLSGVEGPQSLNTSHAERISHCCWCLPPVLLLSLTGSRSSAPG